ncbi:hypothetical protein A9266_21015 [Vibrio tasmaniensis]|nr:hypothetical protein A9266_21015 [Vibrio tasmaniensis]
MEIISHRGYWKTANEKNSKEAFDRSFSLGFGTETDIRDLSGNLVISHDMPKGNEILFDEFLQYYVKSNCSGTLAINVKSDGLHRKISDSLSLYGLENYFVFDMSIPDTLVALDCNMKVFSRVSEYELKSPLWEKSEGIWYDKFCSNSVDTDFIKDLLMQGFKVCIVSAELHKRSHQEQWENIRKIGNPYLQSKNLILCTDLPELAQEYFND